MLAAKGEIGDNSEMKLSRKLHSPQRRLAENPRLIVPLYVLRSKLATTGIEETAEEVAIYCGWSLSTVNRFKVRFDSVIQQ